jgi:hypothetical protein
LPVQKKLIKNNGFELTQIKLVIIEIIVVCILSQHVQDELSLAFCLIFKTRNAGIFSCTFLSACFCSWDINLFWCSGYLSWYSKQYIFFDVRSPRALFDHQSVYCKAYSTSKFRDMLFVLHCLIFQSSVVNSNQIWLRNLQRSLSFMTFWSKWFSPDIWPSLESMFIVQWKF